MKIESLATEWLGATETEDCVPGQHYFNLTLATYSRLVITTNCPQCGREVCETIDIATTLSPEREPGLYCTHSPALHHPVHLQCSSSGGPLVDSCEWSGRLDVAELISGEAFDKLKSLGVLNVLC